MSRKESNENLQVFVEGEERFTWCLVCILSLCLLPFASSWILFLLPIFFLVALFSTILFPLFLYPFVDSLSLSLSRSRSRSLSLSLSLSLSQDHLHSPQQTSALPPLQPGPPHVHRPWNVNLKFYVFRYCWPSEPVGEMNAALLSSSRRAHPALTSSIPFLLSPSSSHLKRILSSSVALPVT